MEDLSRYHKLQSLLAEGVVEPHSNAVASALGFMGLVHHTTWLRDMEEKRRDSFRKQFRYKPERARFWLTSSYRGVQ